MKNRVGPIKPSEVTKKKKNDFPAAVFEAFNELITENFSGGSASFTQKAAEDLMAKKGLGRSDIYKKGWMDIEEVYEKAGWEVEYDQPGYNESYDATFTFASKRRPHY